MSAAPKLRALSIAQPSAIRPSDGVRVGIGHALVDSCSFEQALEAIMAHADDSDGESAFVITPNAQHIVLLNQDADLREIYRRADLVVPDGISLVLAARVFGQTLPERVAGVDLFQSLCAGAASANLKVFFLGGQVGSADLAAARIRERIPSLDVETYCPPMGFENDPAELKRIAELIRNAEPRIVFVGLGAPKQERWIYEHGRKLGVNVYMGVGGSFEMVGGVVSRAPLWVQNLGCEWLYRLCREPRRMWRRYLIGNLHFLAIILSQRIRRTALEVLVRVLKNSNFEAELQDATVRSDLLDIMRRFAAIEQAPSK